MKDFNLKIGVLLICLVFVLRGFSQMPALDELTPGQLKKFGKSAAKSGDVFTAIYFYERYHEVKGNNQDINYTLAELHREARNYNKALEYYEQVYKKAGEKYPFAQFYYALMLKSTGKYDEAIEEFNKFRRKIKGEKDSRLYSKMVKTEIDGCDSAKKIVQVPLNMVVENLNRSVNGPHVELSPVPLNDSLLVYASLKVDSMIFFNNDNVDQALPVRQFYIARKEDKDWVNIGLWNNPANIPGMETGNGVMSRDGNRFYFTHCAKNWQDEMICAIYVMKKTNDTWQNPEKLPVEINDPNYTSTQPALGRTAKSNREIIYFSSDRPDGKGGLDLWYTVWNDKTNVYSKPKNTGSRINTISDEITPYYDIPTRTLFFSTTGLPGIGGLDIFKAFGERGKWTNIKNAGYPLNTSFDDLYFMVGKTGEDGFFVSNRPGGNSFNNETCCDDIYYYRWNEFSRITVTATIYPFEKDRFGRKKDLSNFDFMNPDESIKPLRDAIIALYMKDKETNEYVFMERYNTEGDGKFYFNLQPDQDYQFKMEGFQYFSSEMFLSTQGFYFSDTIEMPPVWVNVLTDKPIVLENIYYEFNSAELSGNAKVAIDTTLLVLLREAPEFIIEIGAHTDSIGGIEFNEKLSQERASNVVKYLVSKNIPQVRLVAKGYGYSTPIAPNTNPDGTDNPQGRELNRRTEFRILGTIGELEDEDFEGED